MCWVCYGDVLVIVCVVLFWGDVECLKIVFVFLEYYIVVVVDGVGYGVIGVVWWSKCWWLYCCVLWCRIYVR